MKGGRTLSRSRGRGRSSPRARSRGSLQSSPRFSSPLHPLLQLQQTIGNQAVGRLIQAKLKISQPGDKSEEEADRMADMVMRMQEPIPQSQDETMKEEGEETILQTKASSSGSPSRAGNLNAGIQGFNGGGQPVSPASRAFFEPRFGQDFSHVRIHTGTRADETAKSINARAFTVGKDIAFGPGQYAPETHAGQRLLGHELTHVVQQAGKGVQIQRDEDTDGGLWESITGAAGRVVEGIGEAIETVGSAVGTALALTKYPKCDTVPTRPPRNSWLDNTGLESIRHKEGQYLSQQNSPNGDSKGATSLVKQALLAWGCETYGLNLLPKNGTKGYYGPEAAAALKQFQLHELLMRPVNSA